MCVCTLVSADSLWASSPCSPPVMKTQHRNTLSSTFTWGSDQARLLFLQGLCLFLSLCSNSVLLWNQRPHPVQDLPIRTARGRKQPAAGFKWNNGGKNIRKQVVPPQVKRWSPFSAWWSSDSEKKTLLDEMNWNSKTQFYKRNLASSTFHRLVSSPFLCRDKGHVVSMWINRTKLLWRRKKSESVLTCLFWSSLSPVREKGDRGTSWRRRGQRNMVNKPKLGAKRCYKALSGY